MHENFDIATKKQVRNSVFSILEPFIEQTARLICPMDGEAGAAGNS